MPNPTAIIVGGGHNALTAAFYLATGSRWGRGGLLKRAQDFKVKVFERREVVGGAAVTEEFHPGFRNSTASYSVGLLSPEVLREMGLEAQGLRLVARKGAHFMPLSATEHLQTSYDEGETLERIARASPRDAEAYARFSRMLEPIVPFLQEQFLRAPPSLGGPSRYGPQLAQVMGSAKRLLSPQAARDMAELFTRSAGEMLDGLFEWAPLKGLLAFDAVTGNYASVYAPGSAYVMLHHVMGQVFGQPGRWGHAMGGMGSITAAMARACVATGGVEVLTGSEVQHVVTEGGRAAGVRLADGSVHRADVVLSGVHPKLLFLDLLADPAQQRQLGDEFQGRVRRYRSGSGTLRINVALSELPRFTASPDDPLVHHSSMLFAPSIEYIEQALRDAHTLGYARRPVIEMMTPSAYDGSLAPPGMHVASLFCQHMDPGCTRTQEAAQAAFDTVDEMAPNFKASILGSLALSPSDLHSRFGLVAGDIFHGQLSLSQIWAARPVIGWGGYATPIPNLFLCASGAHPGGGVTGYPGRNAAMSILTAF